MCSASMSRPASPSGTLPNRPNFFFPNFQHMIWLNFIGPFSLMRVGRARIIRGRAIIKTFAQWLNRPPNNIIWSKTEREKKPRTTYRYLMSLLTIEAPFFLFRPYSSTYWWTFLYLLFRAVVHNARMLTRSFPVTRQSFLFISCRVLTMRLRYHKRPESTFTK